MFSVKKLTALILFAAVLISSLVSCGKAPENSGLIIEYSDFSYEPPKTVAPDYVIAENPLDIRYSSQTGGYPVINGLADRTVQERVNQAIKDEYLRLSAADYLPPATGAKVLEKKNAGKDTRVIVSCTVTNNCQNLFSVEFNYNKMYGSVADIHDRSYGIDVLEYQTFLNFDLTTGKKLKLSDLFIDGVDPARYINAAIVRLISKSDISSESWGVDSMDQGLRLAGAFRGIREDQPFSISWNGELIIILDERNPEFSLAAGRTAVIDISTVSAIPSKFAAKSGVFEKRVNSWHIAARSFPQGSIKSVEIPGTQRSSIYRVEEGDEDPSQRVYFWSDVHNYEGLPDAVNKYLALGWLGTARLVSEAKSRAAALLAEDESVYGSLDIYSNAELVGEYINTTAGYRENYYSWDLEKNLYSDEFMQLASYKKGSDVPLKLEDLFWKGERAEEYMHNAQMEAFKQDRFAYYKNNYNTLARLAQELTEHISGFNIGSVALYVQYDTDVEGLVAKHFPNASKDYRQSLLADIGFVYYNLIGYDNLRIFK